MSQWQGGYTESMTHADAELGLHRPAAWGGESAPSGAGTADFSGPRPEFLEDIAELAELGEGRLDTLLVDRLRAVEQRVEQRLARSRENVVVALAGGTGSGKSSLLNALVDSEVSTPGIKRPTTDHAVAVSIGAKQKGGEGRSLGEGQELGEGRRVEQGVVEQGVVEQGVVEQGVVEQGVEQGREAASLLDWLQVFERYRFEAEGQLEGLAGAIILDLPDIDSVVAEHWDTAERLIERCDLLIWVFDPLKYAQSLSHSRYMAKLAYHTEVLVVVLNHADRLAKSDQAECLGHLQELLDRQGLAAAPSLLTAAGTGEGVDALRQMIAEQVRERRAPVERLRADLRSLKEEVAQLLPAPDAFNIDTGRLVEMQHEALNERDLLQAAGAVYRRMASRATASPTRRLIMGGLSLLSRVLFGRESEDNPHQTEHPKVVVASHRLRYALVDAIDHLAQRLPISASQRLRAKAGESAAPLADDLRQALDSLSIEPRQRLWWGFVGGLRGAAEVGAVAGLVWLVARSAADWLVLPEVPVPMFVGELGWPPVLIFTGIISSTLIGVAAKPAIAWGARRHRAWVRRQISERIAVLAQGSLAGLGEELGQCKQLSRLSRQDHC